MLSGNRFDIVLRNLSGSAAEVEAACVALRGTGFVNYYGMQRFGKFLDNTEVGVALMYKLRINSSKQLLNESNAKAGTMAFTLRSMDEERTAKAGIGECVTHNLFTPYPVFMERSGVHVAHFKTTLLLLPGGNKKATGLPLPDYFVSEKTLGEENAAILAEEAEKAAKAAAKKAAKKAKKNKKK
ncbi:hypothetical protein TeGR_g9301 [Tetraparma gracilis]|uniref:TRUD domain-containing protein n=1 Tax=Tetraparma gracilis TaxID=2962635 RepID=A0ABQ6N2U9_9STRA|nr:hypothetical protein TeGR_g9301 [Tetraparma gracilis]